MFSRLKSTNLVVPLVILIVLVALGCAVLFKKPAPPPEQSNQIEMAQTTLQSDFIATAEISYHGVSFEADCNKTNNGSITLLLTEPQTLQGVTLSIDEQGSTVSYGEMSVTLENDSFLGQSAAALLLSTLNTAGASQGVSFDIDGDAVLITGENEEGEFTLRFDPEDGGTISISLPQQEFSGTFCLQPGS